MIDHAVSLVQCLSLLGYVYGAWLVITHKADAGSIHGREVALAQARIHGKDDPVWHRHLAADW